MFLGTQGLTAATAPPLSGSGNCGLPFSVLISSKQVLRESLSGQKATDRPCEYVIGLPAMALGFQIPNQFLPALWLFVPIMQVSLSTCRVIHYITAAGCHPQPPSSCLLVLSCYTGPLSMPHTRRPCAGPITVPKGPCLPLPQSRWLGGHGNEFSALTEPQSAGHPNPSSKVPSAGSPGGFRTRVSVCVQSQRSGSSRSSQRCLQSRGPGSAAEGPRWTLHFDGKPSAASADTGPSAEPSSI